MDFIEQVFGISPDGGDGTTELAYIAALLVAITAVILRRAARRKASTPSS
jgi:hypothetical protein